MNEEMQILREILEARERRARTQRELINMFRTTLVSFTLNIPGANKNSSTFAKVHETGICLLEDELKKQEIKLVHKIVKVTAAGTEAFLNIDEDATIVKRITSSVEEQHKLGRLFDFDVFSSNGEQISRVQLGLPERKCLLCNENAKLCARSRKHSINELLNKVYQMIDECNK